MTTTDVFMISIPILVVLAFVFGKIAVDKNWKIIEYF